VVALQSLPTRIDVNKSNRNGFVENEKDLGWVSDHRCVTVISRKQDIGFVEKK
jgi:hypothetical protein